jgi:flagella basal body P-ring formation protein FlgA
VLAQVERALEAYVKAKTGEEGWKLNVSLNDEQVASIQELGANLSVNGGKSPWEGKQHFLVSNENSQNPPTQVTAYLTSPPAIVVARHGLPKGVILRADDVKLHRGLSTKGESEVYLTIEEVVGKETTRVIAENQVLDSKLVRPQLLVRRNEIVTLYSRAAGIRVRTTARVRDDGAMGDLVTVESLQDRKPMFARVSGPQEVEIFAQAISAATPSQQATRNSAKQLLNPPVPTSVSALPIPRSHE